MGPAKVYLSKFRTRDLPPFRGPAVLLIDQLKQIYIDGELDIIDTSVYFPKILRKDFTVAFNLSAGGPDPDPTLDLFFGCGSSQNWDGYCNAEVDKMIEQQSIEADQKRRKQLVWRSSASWPKISPGRSYSMTVSRPAGSPTSKVRR